MSRQVDKKIIDLDKKFAKVLDFTGLEQGEFAIECKIQPGTLSKALERSSFSKDIVNKINTRFGVRKAYWEDGREPITEEKGTYVEIPSDKKNPVEENRILKNIIVQMGETNAYLLKRISDLEQGKG